MKCPQCNREVVTSICPFCKFEVAKIQSLGLIKDEIFKIQKDFLSISKRLEFLGDKFSDYEKSLLPLTKPNEPEKIKEKIEQELIDEQENVVLKPKEEQSEIKLETKEESSNRPIPPLLPKYRITVPLIEKSESKEIGEINVGQKWLLIAGIITTVLSVGWFLKYSFDQNWIGPAGRVAMAFMMGMAFLFAGESFRKKTLGAFGLYLIGGGIAILYFAAFAGFQIYKLIPQGTAFGLMVMITALAGSLSLVYDTKWLSVLGLIGGFITPIALSKGIDSQITLMTYMTILNAGILSIAFFKQWKLLNYLGFVLTWVLFTGWFSKYYRFYNTPPSKFWITTLYLNIFFLAYAFVPFVYHIRKEHKKSLSGIGIIMPNTFVAFGYSFYMIKAYFGLQYVSIATIIYSAIFIWMAQFIYSRNKEQVAAFVMLIAKASLFLTITIPIIFSGHWITFFWALQAVITLWIAVKLQNKWMHVSFYILMCIVLFKFVIYDYNEIFNFNFDRMYFYYDYTKKLTERFVTEILVLLSLFTSVMLSKRILTKKIPAEYDRFALSIVFGIVLFIVLNIEVSGFFHFYAKKAKFASISVLWAIFSISLMGLGFAKNNAALRKTAIGLFALTFLKVFLSDMNEVSTPYRIISFLILGLLLIGGSYLYYRLKERIIPNQ
ncbi:MAG: DUF2339 domain-containing protein [Desulfobacterales bacterium]|nr:DUF2339 domain-containing protein [Desulfobacterales bacterium]